MQGRSCSVKSGGKSAVLTDVGMCEASGTAALVREQRLLIRFPGGQPHTDLSTSPEPEGICQKMVRLLKYLKP